MFTFCHLSHYIFPNFLYFYYLFIFATHSNDSERAFGKRVVRPSHRRGPIRYRSKHKVGIAPSVIDDGYRQGLSNNSGDYSTGQHTIIKDEDTLASSTFTSTKLISKSGKNKTRAKFHSMVPVDKFEEEQPEEQEQAEVQEQDNKEEEKEEEETGPDNDKQVKFQSAEISATVKTPSSSDSDSEEADDSSSLFDKFL